MRPLRREILLNALKLLHLAITALAFALATVPVLRESRAVSFGDFFSMRVKIGNFFIFAGLLILWHTLFSSFGLYSSRRFSSRAADVADIVMATWLGTLFLWGAAMVLHIRMATPTFLVVFWALSTLMLVCSRLALRIFLTQTRLRGRNLRDMLIVGTNSRAVEFADKMKNKPELGYRVIGFADRQWAGIDQFRQSGYLLACDIDSLPVFFRNNVVDEVVIALPIRSFHEDASRIASACEEQGIIFRVLSNLFNLKLAHAHAEELDADSWITHYTCRGNGWSLMAKRLLDFGLSLAALIVLAPLLLLTALVIKLTSPGPVLFVQERVGFNKRRFSIYKFRTMVANAETMIRELERLNEVSGPVFKIQHDPRITPIGRLLRKTSIDELPQLLNVLRGDMSVVGPRPLPVRDYEGFNEDWHRRRFSVRPGLTCLWQIAGRSSIPFQQWMELDLQYIDTWSLWLDLRIMLRTIPAVIRGAGAA
jgi:exopolysaccharide biosynthesis polyprenyl glycosylphosphotransferase